MSYYEQAKIACPLCRSEMTELVDEPNEQDLDENYERYRWDTHRCTSPACGVTWQYGDIRGPETDEARVIHIYDEAPRPKRRETSIALHIIWSKDEITPDGNVVAMVHVQPKLFRKSVAPLFIDVQAGALIAGDRDRALREAFSVWRLRAFV